MTLVFTAPRASLLLIDEPETSLHPELLRILALLLQETALETQVVVATHSSDLIGWLQPDEVLIADKEDGQTRFTWADTLNLAEWLAEYTLRDLWLMGHLGGHLPAAQAGQAPARRGAGTSERTEAARLPFG